MYINAYKETHDNLYLTKSHNILSMISFEIERILDKDDVCETTQEFLPKLKEIKQFAGQCGDVASFILKFKEDIRIEIQGFKFILEHNPNNHVWVSIEYDYIGNNPLGYTTYTSVIEHIDDID